MKITFLQISYGRSYQSVSPTAGSSNGKSFSVDVNPMDEGESGRQNVPYYNHNDGFKVDLAAIPFCTSLGTVILLEMFKK